jgi:hypothetical protein
MAEHKENGHARQDAQERQGQIKREQQKQEQNEGYDEAARGGKGVPSTNVGTSPDTPKPAPEDPFDKAAKKAAADVRRRESSAE